MSRDIHFLGEFNSISEAWKLYPNGGGYGDYIRIDGENIYWNEDNLSWGGSSEQEGEHRPSETIPHDIDVKGWGKFRDGIKVGEYVEGEAGAAIDKHGNADFRTAKIDTLFIEYDGEHIPLSEYIEKLKSGLPPNWEDYSNAQLFEDMRFLVFDPQSNKKYYTTMKDILDLLRAEFFEGGYYFRRMEIEQELESMGPGEVQIIQVFIYDAWGKDVLDLYRQIDVERESGDPPSDAHWNQQYGLNRGDVFQLTFDDLGFRYGLRSVTFRVIARPKSVGENVQVSGIKFKIDNRRNVN